MIRNIKLILPALFILTAVPCLAAPVPTPTPQARSQQTLLMQQKESSGSAARPLSLSDLKLRLSKMGHPKVITSPRIKNPFTARPPFSSSAEPAPALQRSGPEIQSAQTSMTSPQGNAIPASPKANARSSSGAMASTGRGGPGAATKTMSQSGTAGHGTSTIKSTAAAPNQRMWGADPCLNDYKGSLPVLISIDGQSPNGFVFTPDPHHSVHVFTGCRFGSAMGKIGLMGTQGGYLNLQLLKPIEGGWSDERIVAMLDPGLSGLYDDENVDVRLHIAGQEFGDSLAKVIFRAQRTGPTLVASVPQSAVTIFPEGSPTFISPVPSLYGLSGSMALFRLGLTNSVLKGEDKISLYLKPGFVVDSVQIQYLVYSGDGSTSVSAPDSSHPPVVQGNDILIDWPIFSVTQAGQSQTIFYSVYALSMWVDGPVGFKSPWANDPN